VPLAVIVALAVIGGMILEFYVVPRLYTRAWGAKSTSEMWGIPAQYWTGRSLPSAVPCERARVLHGRLRLPCAVAITDDQLHIQRTAPYSQVTRWVMGFAGWAIPQSDFTVLSLRNNESTLLCDGSKITILLTDATSDPGLLIERLRNLAARAGNA